MSEPIDPIQMRGVRLHRDGTAILNGVDLVVPQGQRVALIGASGAGKSTLLGLLAGLIRPDEGTVMMLGRNASTLRGRGLQLHRREVGMVHQGDNLVPGLRVAHNVLLGRMGQWSWWQALRSRVRPQELSLAEEALGKVELAERAWATPEELSGGEQQRVAIARLMVQAPRVVLADEPASALDHRLGREVIALLMAAAAAHGGPAIVAVHSMELLRQGAQDWAFDRVVALKEGQILFDGKPEMLDRDLLRRIYGAGFWQQSLPRPALPRPALPRPAPPRSAPPRSNGT